MSDAVLHIETIDDFNNLVENNGDKPIIIDFWAPWCGPCKSFSPIFEAVQKTEFGNDFVFAKLNTESEAGPVSQALDVQGIPAIVFIKDKKEIHRNVGALRKKQFVELLSKIKEALAKQQ